MLLKLLQVHWTCMTMRATISWCSFIHTWQAPSQQPVALQLVRCKYTVQSMSVTLSQPSQLTSQIFLDSLKDWQHPPDSQCGKRFSNKPAEGIPFNEDVTFDEHGNADSSWHCTGMRVSSHCLKLNLKSFFVFSVVLLCRGGNLQRKAHYRFHPTKIFDELLTLFWHLSKGPRWQSGRRQSRLIFGATRMHVILLVCWSAGDMKFQVKVEDGLRGICKLLRWSRHCWWKGTKVLILLACRRHPTDLR